MKTKNSLLVKILLLIAIFTTAFGSIDKKETPDSPEKRKNLRLSAIKFENDVAVIAASQNDEFIKVSASAVE